MLPGGSGLDLLRELKHLRRTDSVLIISAKDSLDDKVDGLELGADDYLTKAFSIWAELNARIKSFNTPPSGNKAICLSPWAICCSIRTNGRRKFGGAPLQLNRKEFDLLYYLW